MSRLTDTIEKYGEIVNKIKVERSYYNGDTYTGFKKEIIKPGVAVSTIKLFTTNRRNNTIKENND